MKTFAVTVVLICVLALIVPAYAQENLVSDEPPYTCPHTNGAYYQPGAFPRFDASAKTLLLVNSSGETVRVLDSIEENVRIINWSPDCRYLTGAVGLITSASALTSPEVRNQPTIKWKNRDIVIWDATTGGRVHTLENNVGHYMPGVAQPAVIWHPASSYALVLGGCYSIRHTCIFEREHEDFIWHRDNNHSYRIDAPEDGQTAFFNRASFNQYYWDVARSWLWGSGPGGVSAYDITTGQEVRLFPNRQQPTLAETRFRFSDDATLIVVYGISQPGAPADGGITVYDIETAAPVYVNAEGFGAPNIPLADYHPVALSADNRYLIAGYNAIRVWDIQNLPASVDDRLPIYRHAGPEALIWSADFSDWGVIETTSEEGTQHWDLHTGAFIPAD
jgi:WD40 repeat protein